MSKLRNLAKVLLVAGLAAVGLALPQAASAGSYKVLEKFAGAQGKYPSGDLIADSAGNLYGVTAKGGSKNCKGGCGVVYRIAADGTYIVLHAFQGKSDGGGPFGNLLLDASGNLYGTTEGGGADNSGTVFKLAPDGLNTILHSFGGAGDGIFPHAGLVIDASGNLYGTTWQGGASGHDEGTAFKLAPDGTETVLYSFCSVANCADGRNPMARLLLDGAGDLYGTTPDGGAFDLGTVFKISHHGTFSVVYSFGTITENEGFPEAGLIADQSGNLYGTTYTTAFEIAPDGSETILHHFQPSGIDGSNLQSELLLDGQGNLFGTAFQDGALGGGTVFELEPDGNFAVLHDFARDDGKGSEPNTAVLLLNGQFYGTTQYGGRSCHLHTGCGVVYELKP